MGLLPMAFCGRSPRSPTLRAVGHLALSLQVLVEDWLEISFAYPAFALSLKRGFQRRTLCSLKDRASQALLRSSRSTGVPHVIEFFSNTTRQPILLLLGNGPNVEEEIGTTVTASGWCRTEAGQPPIPYRRRARRYRQ